MTKIVSVTLYAKMV